MLLFLLCLAVSPLGAAGLYRWVDSEGVLHVSDRPPATGETVEELQAREIQTVETVSIGDLTAVSRRLVPPASAGPSVILYSTEWCGYCKRARRHFREQGIRFSEYDVETSARGRRDFAALGGGGVPVIVIGERVMRGFNAEAFDRAYRGR